ncbi:hypothetical protein AMS68_004276 [Peltaster fructicola]|uniref:HTH APSES-type domain-containing protein n=1 Tax=Peltaster fructicola TaxID=286661 RepID=A0A6H0XVW6_9PEZI|nr:hypothetical protein AMS68_004276 [Peltaster fructicola]
MNQAQPYMDVGQGHGTAPAPPPSYNYGQQPQALQPASQQYQPANYGGYSNYTMAPMSQGHPVPVSTPMSQGMVSQSMNLPAMSAPLPNPSAPVYGAAGHQFDTTGQIAPAGMKPRVTATLWEDEGSLCFQVEAQGVCVARREDNHMINGTKLLNVAGMTRGRRDGILKSEKTRHVVKIGPMHLKGVWIPFDRALDFANKEKITELLYPLFVHNIGALLYHPTNQGRPASIGNASMAAGRPERQHDYMRTPTGTQPPPLTHHHTMSNPIGPPQPPHSIAPHPSSGRPGLDRAHTFPTPPASASSMMNLGNSGSSYGYGGPPNASMHASTTPPSASQAISYADGQHYDPSRAVYSTPTYNQYPSSQQYGHAGHVKADLSGQARAGAENDHADSKTDGYPNHADGETDGPAHHDPTHISTEMTSSPQQNGSGRATPRTTTYGEYATPQRGAQLPSSNLYNVMSNDGRSTNGAESYAPQSYQPPQSHYPSSMNGLSNSNKRVREVDDSEDQYGRGMNSPGGGLKRQRTDGAALNSRPISHPPPVKPVR